MSGKDELELARVFASVLRPFIDELKQEIVGVCVEILEQQASDFASIMNATNLQTIAAMKEPAERAAREREREEQRISDLMLEGLRKQDHGVHS